MQNNMVRIDRFLQHTKLVPSRKEAKALLDERFVLLNNKFAKPASEVKNGDIIIVNFPEESIVIKANINQQDQIIYVGYDVLDVKKKEIFIC